MKSESDVSLTGKWCKQGAELPWKKHILKEGARSTSLFELYSLSSQAFVRLSEFTQLIGYASCCLPLLLFFGLSACSFKWNRGIAQPFTKKSNFHQQALCFSFHHSTIVMHVHNGTNRCCGFS